MRMVWFAHEQMSLAHESTSKQGSDGGTWLARGLVSSLVSRPRGSKSDRGSRPGAGGGERFGGSMAARSWHVHEWARRVVPELSCFVWMVAFGGRARGVA
eukprot:1915867-Alexandrium_andersonii.AAC.1